MQHLEVNGAVRLIDVSLGVKRLMLEKGRAQFLILIFHTVFPHTIISL